MNLIIDLQFLNYQIFDKFLLFYLEPIRNNKNDKNIMSSKNKKDAPFYQALEEILKIIPKSKTENLKKPSDKLYQAIDELLISKYSRTTKLEKL